MQDIKKMAKNARQAYKELSKLSTKQKNEILFEMAEKIDKDRAEILSANQIDLSYAKINGIKEIMIDRLSLNDERINSLIDSIRLLANSKDYIGEKISEVNLDNGLRIIQRRESFGVIGFIYESRPNVTVDVCSICLKNSAAVILKGGKDAINTNKAIVKLLNEACFIKNIFQLIELSDRAVIYDLLNLKDDIDLIIPRGGKGLIDFVRDNSKIPIIETGTGNCHIFVDESADVEEAIKIIVNAKVQRPSVCNAVESLVIHKGVAEKLLKKLSFALEKQNVEIRGCIRTQKMIGCILADEKDWKEEYLDLIISIMIVDDIGDAINHINNHSSKHSESILSKNKDNIERFFNEIDSAVVYSNASTRFTDGAEFGFGAEIGISTQKIHVRGPFSLRDLTTTKYIVYGNGQIRE